MGSSYVYTSTLTLHQRKILVSSKLKASVDSNIDINESLNFALGMLEKHCGKRRKCWLPAFSSFPTMFSKGFFPQCH